MKVIKKQMALWELFGNENENNTEEISYISNHFLFHRKKQTSPLHQNCFFNSLICKILKYVILISL